MSGLENIKNENVDLEKIPIEEVFQLLKCTSEGLTTQEGDDRIQLFGPNKLEEKKESKILKFLGFMWNPLSWVMEAAAIMAIALANGDGRPPDWQDFVGIICLLVINSTISFIEENNAGNAAAALMAGLAPKTKEKIPIEEVFQLLKCTSEGLTTQEGDDRIQLFGPNKLEEKKESKILKFLGFMWNPLSWVMEAAAIMAIALANGDGRPPDWQDFVGIICLLVINSTISFIEENNAGNAAAALMAGLAPKTKVMCCIMPALRQKALATINNYAERGLRSLAVARQLVPEKTKESSGGPWEFVGLLPLFDPPRHDSAETIRRALNLGVNVKMITGDQLAIGKETGRRLGMGTNMYPSAALLGTDRDSNMASVPIEELIEKADGFAGVFPEHKYEIIYAVSITIRIVFGFMLIALIWEFDFSAFMVLIIAILNDGTIMTISKDRVKPSPTPDSWKLNEIFATGIVLGGYQAVMSVIFFWVIHKTDFCSDKFGVRSIMDNNDELMSAVYLQVSIISQALIFVTRSRSWSFVERPGALLMIAFVIAQLVATLIAVYADWTFAKVKGIGWGWAAVIWVYSILTYIPQDILKFAIRYILSGKAWVSMFDKRSALTTRRDYGAGERQAEWAREQRRQHVSIISQALIFVTRSRSWSFVERPGALLMIAFVIAQLVATLIAVYADWTFAKVKGIGWGWAAVIWVYSILTYIPQDILKFAIRYILSGKAWVSMFDKRTALTTRRDYGAGERQAEWAREQRTQHGLQTRQEVNVFPENGGYRELSQIVEQAKKRAEIARLREIHTFKGHVESVAKLKGLDIDTSGHHYTL
ncbi:hypothetical protein DY000_02005610 [Brassica cretica]|uniref:Cation-transporting P-type ATPase N-terminal domain-containing protein n=1 Tax=Brassica cretica TaxID=69181 RepID=A0ABQ7C7R0_BRACR|nr:hypothetical protein DY000_02005610 [Brassica cretica]